MTYSPINDQAYTAAFSGAIAGMAISGWITSDTGSTYDDVCKVAGAFAQAFDVAWNDATTLNMLDVLSITSITQQDFSMRGPGPASSTRFQDPANWTRAARACATLVLRGELYFSNQGITPPPFGGGGGGTLTPLTNTFWMDASSTHHTGVAVNNGSQGAFSTFAQVVATAVTQANLLMVPLDYSAEGPVDISSIGGVSIDGLNVTFGGAIAVLPPLTANAIAIQGVQMGDGTGTAAPVLTVGDGAEAFLNNTTFLGSIGSVGALSLTATRCSFAASVPQFFAGTTINVLQLFECIFASSNTTPIDVTNWAVDWTTLASFMQNQPVTPGKIMGSPLGQTNMMADADLTVNAAAYDTSAVCVSAFGAGFTATRTLTIDLTHIPDTGIVWVYAVNNDFSVNNLIVTDGVHATTIDSVGAFLYKFRNVAGTLTLEETVLAPVYPIFE